MANQLQIPLGVSLFGTGSTSTANYSSNVSNQVSNAYSYAYNGGNQTYSFSPSYNIASGYGSSISSATNPTLTPTSTTSPTITLTPSTSQSAAATSSSSNILMYAIIGAVAIGGLYFISKSSGSGSREKRTNITIAPNVKTKAALT